MLPFLLLGCQVVLIVEFVDVEGFGLLKIATCKVRSWSFIKNGHYLTGGKEGKVRVHPLVEFNTGFPPTKLHILQSEVLSNHVP